MYIRFLRYFSYTRLRLLRHEYQRSRARIQRYTYDPSSSSSHRHFIIWISQQHPVTPSVPSPPLISYVPWEWEENTCVGEHSTARERKKMIESSRKRLITSRCISSISPSTRLVGLDFWLEFPRETNEWFMICALCTFVVDFKFFFN